MWGNADEEKKGEDGKQEKLERGEWRGGGGGGEQTAEGEREDEEKEEIQIL